MKLIGKMGKIFSATWQIKRIIIAFLKNRGRQSPPYIVTRVIQSKARLKQFNQFVYCQNSEKNNTYGQDEIRNQPITIFS